MKEDKNIVNLLVSSDIINMACKDIADKKTNKEVNELLIEELSEVIKAEKLSYKLNQLQKGQMVSVTYYNKDAYEIVDGLITNFAEIFRTVTIVKTVIHFDDILDVNGENIKSLDEI